MRNARAAILIVLVASSARMEAEGFTVEPYEWWHFNYPRLAAVSDPRHPFEAIHSTGGPRTQR